MWWVLLYVCGAVVWALRAAEVLGVFRGLVQAVRGAVDGEMVEQEIVFPIDYPRMIVCAAVWPAALVAEAYRSLR